MNNVMDELQRLWRVQAMKHPLGALFLALEKEAFFWGLTFVVDKSGCLCYGSGNLYETELPAFCLIKTMGSIVNSVSNWELDRHGDELWANLNVVSEELWDDVSQISDLESRRQVLDMVSLERHAQAVKELAFEGDYLYPSLGVQKMLRDKVY